jgi:hypothetical protein
MNWDGFLPVRITGGSINDHGDPLARDPLIPQNGLS